MTEELNYKVNCETVLQLQNAFIEKVILSLDTNPTFDPKSIPFSFEYSFSASLITNKGNFNIITSQTSEGSDTFWIDTFENNNEIGKDKIIRSNVKNVFFEAFKESKYPFKLVFELEKSILIFYCGEIYNESNGKVNFKVNDEMLLVFEDMQESQKFETLVNYG
ncbi:MAG: hypothetical protein NTZ47_00090 [Bacteroidetes bacterium]|nr:hypothetical protein [Bacteroidota bacterium]